MTTPPLNNDRLISRNQFDGGAYLQALAPDGKALRALVRTGPSNTFAIAYNADGRIVATGLRPPMSPDDALSLLDTTLDALLPGARPGLGWTPISKAAPITVIVSGDDTDCGGEVGYLATTLAKFLLEAPDDSRSCPRWAEEALCFNGYGDTNQVLRTLHATPRRLFDLIFVEDIDVLLERRPHVLDLLLATGARIVATATCALSEPHPDIEFIHLR